MSEEQNIQEENFENEKVNEHFPEDSHAPQPAGSRESGAGSQEQPSLANQQAIQSSIANTETDAMEVHHHSHSHGKKTWKEYFWEFLMLFLAVFCGFLAEYQLEHKIEKDRAHQYVISFYEDLAGDTSRLASLAEMESKKIEALNNLKSCYDALLKDPKASTCLFELIKSSTFNNPIRVNDRTLRQLANAGGYRLLRKEDADSIVSYETMVIGYENFATTAYQQAQDNVRNTFNSVIDFPANVQLYQNTTTSNKDYVSEINVPLLFSADRVLLNKYFNELFQYLRVMVGHRNRVLKLKEKASEIILYFKGKYHFD